jgi:hypothetical protein
MNKKNNQKYLDITLTDIQFHVAKPRKPLPAGRVIEKSLKSGNPSRIYSNELSITKDDEIRTLLFKDKDFVKLIEKANKEGRIVRILFPDGGMPFIAGSDTIENLKSKERKNKI